MKKVYGMKIELLSDICCGTGEGNGSNIDVCAAFDETGLPIIPAKRIKGLLRECGEFLVGYRVASRCAFKKVFGGLNGEDGIIRVDNAVVEDYETIKNNIIEILKAGNDLSGIITKQAVENYYTAVRAQTSIDEQTGIAKDHSLRTTQTVKKGSAIFISEILLDNPSEEDEILVKNCVKTLRHIGLNKSRGFGEVKCTIEEKDQQPNINKLPDKIAVDGTDPQVTFNYKITLLDDIVMSAGSYLINDFISGAMLIGAFAKYTKNYEWFTDVILKNATFSNAYICDGNFEYTPAPLSLVYIKNEDDEGKKVFNCADSFEKDEEKQYVQYGGYTCICEGKIMKKSVRKAVEYHHTNGVSGAESTLFTYEKILKGQTLKGTVTASESIINLLKDVIKNNENVLYLGGSATAQYAKCRFEFGEEEIIEEIEVANKMVVEFLSDVIVYDEFGGNSGNITHLSELVKRKIIEFGEMKAYSKTVTTGGFNAKWKLPKRQYTAFIKGTVLELTGCNPDDASNYKINKTGYIGVLCNEGYGQYRIRAEQNNTFYITKSNPEEPGDFEINVKTEKIIKEIELNYLMDYYKKEAMNKANKVNVTQMSNSCAMRLLSAYQSSLKHNDIQTSLKEFITKNFTSNDELTKFSNEAVNSFDTIKIPDITYMNEIRNGNKNKIFKEYIKSYLKQIKRRYQRNENKNRPVKKIKR